MNDTRDPRGFTDWEHEPDEFDRQVAEGIEARSDRQGGEVMAIRLRESGGVLVALCAAETDAEPGDRYLSDAEHYALAAKFAHDWHGQTLDWECPEEWAEMAKHKKRDAKAELDAWLATIGTPLDREGE